MIPISQKLACRPSVESYAEHYYTFVNDPEAFLVADLISKHMTGERVLDLGCGPVHHILMLFLRNARQTVGLDIDEESLAYIAYCRDQGHILINQLAAVRYLYWHVLEQPLPPNPEKFILKYYERIQDLRLGNILEEIPEYDNAFDSVMEIGGFGGLKSIAQYEQAVGMAYHYLKPGGRLLMLDWLQNRFKRSAYRFSGRVVSLIRPADYPEILRTAGFKIILLDETDRISKPTRDLGCRRIVYAVAEK